jgi:ribosomal protein S11
MPWAGPDYQFAVLGNFNGSDTTDMMLRSSTGAFEIYDVSNNRITTAASLGEVGLDWQVAGFGKFNGDRTTDMMMRNVDTAHSRSTTSTTIWSRRPARSVRVGLEWQVAGFGDFNGDGTSDMVLRNKLTGDFEVYDIKYSRLASAGSMGAVGMDWQVAGFGDFNGDRTTDMMLRNVETGTFELYDINNNTVTTASAIGQVGLEWQVAGFGPFNGVATPALKRPAGAKTQLVGLTAISRPGRFGRSRLERSRRYPKRTPPSPARAARLRRWAENPSFRSGDRPQCHPAPNQARRTRESRPR